MSTPFEQVSEFFNFSVDKRPLFGMLPTENPEIQTPLVTPHFGLFRSDTNVCVGNAVSEGYEPHTLDDILTLVEAAGTAFDMEFEVNCHWHEGHHIIIQPTKEYRAAIYGTDDNIFPRFVISARYDGRAINAFLGMFRDACLNMARLQSLLECAAVIRHTKNMRSKLKDLIAVFERLKSSWPQVVATANALQAKTVNIDSFVDAVFQFDAEAPKREQTMHENRKKQIIARIVHERHITRRPPLGADMMVSGWEAFNGVQGFIQHDSKKRSKVTGFDRMLAASTSKEVLRAERLLLD